jgi:hypothetical protein
MRGLHAAIQRAVEHVKITRKVSNRQKVSAEAQGEFGEGLHGVKIQNSKFNSEGRGCGGSKWVVPEFLFEG